MGFFSIVPTRSNSGRAEASWWNALKNAGIALESAVLGSGGISETSVAIADNQSSPANVTGLIHDSANVRSAWIEYTVRRVATATVIESGILVTHFDGTSWSIQKLYSYGTAGMDFTIHSTTGQVLYATDDMAGSYDADASKMTFRSRVFAT